MFHRNLRKLHNLKQSTDILKIRIISLKTFQNTPLNITKNYFVQVYWYYNNLIVSIAYLTNSATNAFY